AAMTRKKVRLTKFYLAWSDNNHHDRILFGMVAFYITMEDYKSPWRGMDRHDDELYRPCRF
ncbi:MAG: hypothetical protein OCD76_25485, partial [Reichenbachiella sp.]